MDIGWFFRERCPNCKRRGLEGRTSREFYEYRKAHPNLILRPAPPAYMECVYCGTRFFVDYHYTQGGPFRRGRRLSTCHAISDQEWDEKVMPKEGNDGQP